MTQLPISSQVVFCEVTLKGVGAHGVKIHIMCIIQGVYSISLSVQIADFYGPFY